MSGEVEFGKHLKVLEARQNNLKGFNLELPFYNLIVVTGVSGAGKSSLVFDTLYAEGQRRYIETFSSYLRQYFERLPRPRVKDILNIPAALSFPQGNYIKTSRSTVATLTEISHFTKMLFYQAGIPKCPNCGVYVKYFSAREIAKEIIKKFENIPCYIIAPLEVKESFDHLKAGLLSAGFFRVFYQGKVCEIDELESAEKELEVVVYRCKPKDSDLQAIIEAVEQAIKMSSQVVVRTLYGEEVRFFAEAKCPYCGFVPPKKTPNMFSFNTSQGACPRCNGFGNLLVVDFESLVKYPFKSIKRGAIPLLEYPFMFDVKLDLIEFLDKKGISSDTPFEKIPDPIKEKIFYGEGSWYGLKEVIDWLESKRYKQHIRILLTKLRREIICPDCKGTRFNQKSLLFYVNDLNIGEFYSFDIETALSFTKEVKKNYQNNPAIYRIVREIERRLNYLKQVGLGYLTLNRTSRTLSGGEASRCLLTRALSSNLVETLYLIDEPTTGLHPKDTARVLEFMQNLVSQRNTVVVVEHDPEIIVNADHLVELGPEGGEKGGYLLFNGEPKKIFDLDTPTSSQLKRISQKRDISKDEKEYKSFLCFKKAKKYNLKSIDIRLPIGGITCIVGCSGSGKSTLLEEVIYKDFENLRSDRPFTSCEDIEGAEKIASAVFLSQEPLAKSPRAVVATYLGIFTYIRKLLASTDTAKAFGYEDSFFSFNSPVAQCPECKGLGVEIVEMQFLSDLVIPCEICKGTRFRPEVLKVKWREKNIAEILELTVDQALDFFGNHPLIRRPLELMQRLGLGYLKLGQPLSTLSGGEAQRLKIVETLSKLKGVKGLILLDEPTVGLHLKDVEKLVNALRHLSSLGHTVVVVEHNPEVILGSDWVIELGPEGGERGGYLLFQGKIKEFLKTNTPTAKYLKEYLSGLSLKTPTRRKKEERTYEEPKIKLRGIRHHNLKNIDIDIPREKLVVVTGVSGSGKSTLAFDVIFNEGQRRFLETLPAYLRQFFKLHEEIDFDLISGIPPTVALEQKSGEISSRSVVGTLTDIFPYLRLLFARVSKGYCPLCEIELSCKTDEELKELFFKKIKELDAEELTFVAPIIKSRKGSHREVFLRYLKQGYHSFIVNGRLRKVPPVPSLPSRNIHDIDLVVGKAKKNSKIEVLEDLFFKAISEGGGECRVFVGDKRLIFSRKMVCPECGTSLEEPDPLLFAFNTKQGRCPVCKGLGKVYGDECYLCKGTRYKKEVSYYRVGGKTIIELLEMDLVSLKDFLNGLEFKGKEEVIAKELISEITKRIDCLIDLGVGYLTLGRSADTLSSGEAKRVRIAGEVGSNLTGVAYILDEPTIGLHPRDTEKLISVLKKLRDKGNTVIVVEHDEDTIKSADFIIDMGPGGGKNGGEVVFAGTYKQLIRSKNSITAKVLRSRSRKRIKSKKRKAEEFLILEKVSFRNLKGISVKIPLGCLTVVVGVSGSGKSTLVCDVLCKIKSSFIRDKVKKVKNAEKLTGIYMVDHSPIGNTPRSTPATYVGVFTEIRKAFTNTKLAKERGYKEGYFSFNTTAGACPHCKGQGYIKLELKFLPEVYQMCEYCKGKRYKDEVLEVKLRGKSIADVLEMDFAEAAEFFKNHAGIYRKLEAVCRIGLDYLSLGQPSPSLSGGEAQRLKLAKEFSKMLKGKVLYVLDEPTTGLHISDVEKLVDVIQGLVDAGHTVVVIEHNPEFIKHADWVIELGPEGGERGGYLLFQGEIEEFLKADTPTSKVLKEYVGIM